MTLYRVYLPALGKCLAIAVFVLGLAACTSMKESEMPENWSAERLYKEGKEALDHEDYRSAIDLLEKLETRFPFGELTQQGMLMTAFAYYKNSDPQSAVATADRFIKLYPTHPDADYAYYLRGLADFHTRDAFMDNLFSVDPSTRDPGSVLRSYQYFAELIKRFPNSKYAKDARQRMVFLSNSLAHHELHVAEYYMRRGAYAAAASRAKYVLETYPSTPAIADALAMLIRAYHKLGIDDLAQDSLRVLEKNYPKYRDIKELRKLTTNT
ncbi:MAG: outer membrane protein assembly factor BamD [Pseudomonadota bacterium]